MAANLSFLQIKSGKKINIAGFDVTPHQIMHPGDSYAYKVERDGKAGVYATDASYNDLKPEAIDAYVKFYEKYRRPDLRLSLRRPDRAVRESLLGPLIDLHRRGHRTQRRRQAPHPRSSRSLERW